MTDKSKTPDHSIPIIGVPLQVGKFYNSRNGGVWECVGCSHYNSIATFRNTVDNTTLTTYLFGNVYPRETSDLDLISEYTPPAKVKAYTTSYKDGSVSGYWPTLYQAIEAADCSVDAEYIIEMHEVARHPVNKGGV